MYKFQDLTPISGHFRTNFKISGQCPGLRMSTASPQQIVQRNCKQNQKSPYNRSTDWHVRMSCGFSYDLMSNESTTNRSKQSPNVWADNICWDYQCTDVQVAGW